MKKYISLFLSLIFVFSLCSCSSEKKQKQYSKTFFDLFDTVSTVTAFDDSQESFDAHYNTVYEELKRYSELFDIYNEYEGIVNLRYINDNAAKAPVKADEDTVDFLLRCKEMYYYTDGKVNVCMGSVLSLWHESREFSISNPEKSYIPSQDDLNNASKHTDIEDLIINEGENTVFFNDSQMKLDTGAVAKGYVCDKIYEFITENNIWNSALINLGGNVKSVGFKQDNSKFNIGIENPSDESNYAAAVKISDGQSVITSGGYQRYYTYNGRDYCHIIDPDTLMPSEKIKSVSVISNDSAKGDALSTGLFCMTVEEGEKLIENLPDTEAVWVDNNDNIYYSSGLK